jgi:hypothetical protein
VGEQAADVGGFIGGGDVAELGAHEVEAARRHEGEGVGDGEARRERGQAPLRERDQRRREIDAVSERVLKSAP